MTEGDFHLSCCTRNFSLYRFFFFFFFLGGGVGGGVRTVPAAEFCEYPIVLCRAVECVWLVVVVQ